MTARDDVDEQLRWERRARALLEWASLAAAEAAHLDLLWAPLLSEICAATRWPIGHALVVERQSAQPGDIALVSTGIFHLDDPARDHSFREITATWRFPPGVGLPGRVLRDRRPQWIVDVTAGGSDFPRAAEAALGVRAAFAFPVLVRGEVVAVLEFATPEAHAPDGPLLEVMGTVGTICGFIFERSRAATALADSELRYRSLAETANDAIITTDSAGRVTSWNRGAQAIFGWREEEMLGHLLNAIIPPRYRAQHEAGMARVRSGGARHVIGRTVELMGVRRDGSELPVELSLATWTIGADSFYTGILRDISDRKAQQAELERSRRAAIDASRAKSLFLANMSHELRTPLNAILGYAQLLERDRTASATQREYLSTIARAGEHLLGLINDVLSIARIEAGEATLEVAPFDLARTLAGLRELFHLRAEARGLALRIEQLPSTIVSGDEGKLRQVLINLLGNAIKFTGRGEVALSVAWSDGRGHFAVADTGPGIAPEELARLFRPFAQGDGGRHAGEGAGLGLAISRHAVELMGGELTVESTVGRGTRFAFSLPLPASDAATSERRRVIGFERAPGEPAPRMLVVDNDADNRRLLALLLESVGFEVDEAADGAEAVARAAERRPALIWMDMRMPVLDGYEATRRIRAYEAACGDRRRAAIIALTASAFDHDRPAILAAGCDAILPKPFREETLFEALALHLGLRPRYADTQRPAPAELTLSVEALRALPLDARQALHAALTAGDDLGAQAIVDRLAPAHGAIAAALSDSLHHFQVDRLLALLEEAAP